MFVGKNKQNGFTIVELLIVVVIIAILAAITIVAYNGIQNRAKTSAAQSAASQAGKKIASSATLNADLYPTYANLATETGLTPGTSASSVYQYTVSGDQKTFCLTSTTNKISYYVSNISLLPTLGACAGHIANGVGQIITNLIDNPSVEVNSSNWSLHGGLTAGGRVSSGGKWVWQGTRNGTTATAMYIAQVSPVTVTQNTNYTASVLVTSSVAQTIQLQIRAGGTTVPLGTGTSVVLAANTPTRISNTVDVGSATNVQLAVLSTSGSVGDVITADEAMLITGSTNYAYSDGNTPGWVWSGTADLSTSSGPAL